MGNNWYTEAKFELGQTWYAQLVLEEMLNVYRSYSCYNKELLHHTNHLLKMGVVSQESVDYLKPKSLSTTFHEGDLALVGEFTVLPADDPHQSQLGWIIYEEVGTVIINDYALSSVSFATDFPDPPRCELTYMRFIKK